MCVCVHRPVTGRVKDMMRGRAINHGEAAAGRGGHERMKFRYACERDEEVVRMYYQSRGQTVVVPIECQLVHNGGHL